MIPPIVTNQPMRTNPPVALEAKYVSIPPSLTVGVKATAQYTYFSSLGKLEANKPPYADDLLITGTLAVGNTLTATLYNLIIPNGKTEGTHIFRWYRCTDTQEANDILLSETSSTYTLVEADAGKVIRAECNPVQTGGLNTTGETVYSFHTDRVTTSSFNPIFANTWETIYTATDASVFNTTSRWANNAFGYSGKSAVQDGVRALPTYDGAQQAIRFTRASLQCLGFPRKSPAWVAPMEIVIRFKMNAFNNNQYLLAFSSSHFIYITSTGGVNVSGGTLPSGTIATGQWYLMRVILNGTSTTITINNGSPVTVTSSTAGLGTGTSRIGVNFSGSSVNFLDGWISHIFISDNVSSDTVYGNMKTWFTTYYPYP